MVCSLPPLKEGKKQKKKWSKVKDKAQHAVVMDKTIQERLNKDVLTYRFDITTAVLEKGVIKKIVGHHKLNILQYV
ncbi:hypothetical protein FN846DRAFT_904154 [Sphaerosporella brunnea]|uniref:40S ribosomal protein S25 n=1 Tax=Sphaerosporella brunnea TaxID=1250544 RepID=A0A5J5F4V1_9PEZI|nr:hypothetical protein FN846DRAFT_904154 [Sphaerosporella brunnea]